MSDSESNNDNKVKNFFIRIFDDKGKNPVPGEERIDNIIPNRYDPDVEENKINNKIKQDQNLVWIVGGIGSFLLILILPILAYANLFYLSHQLSLNKEETQLNRIEKMYENARNDASDLSKMIVPSLFTIVVTSIFNANKEVKEQKKKN